ncbi:hypothetical protein [Methylobacterium sp. WL6]|uniref:hypothetical protein n=1 Tax=Methylobacterium sp. WL6 TaxID=2603901 RepID=UPI0011CA607E|nr:hypothetical protein [Methylobacterium sp. WL6]TXN72202.1 hypothetical protein FV230_05840 [Methylobacterium sp. WL6]
MSELDLDDLTAEIFKRVLKMRSTLTEEEFDFLAGEILFSMGAAAMRKAEGQALGRRSIRPANRTSNVVEFPIDGRRDVE